MSLINDALKKAKQAQEQAPPPSDAPEFRSAETKPTRDSGPSLLLPGLLVAVILVGGVLIWLGLSGRKPAAEGASSKPAVTSVPAPATQPEIKMAQPAETKTVSPPPSAEPKPVVAPPAPIAATETPKIQSTETSAAPAQVVVEPPKPSVPKLGGIFFNPTRPSAVLNNKTVYVGSHVGEFTVLAITAQTVTVTGLGRTNVLSLSE